MRLTILSNPFPTPELTSLTQFVVKYCESADLAHTTIKGGRSVGADDKPGFGGVAVDEAGTYTVTVMLNDRASYPRTQRLNLLTPEIRFEAWQEEFVLVLAHELRHIDQFALGAFRCGEELEAEVDAEKFGAAVLGAWRTSRQHLTESRRTSSL